MSTSYIPELNIKENFNRVKEIAKQLVKVTGAKCAIYMRHTDEEMAHVNTRTNVITLSYMLGMAKSSYIKFTIGHELGHPIIFPVNIRWWKYYIAYAKKVGYDNPHYWTNILADLFVNEWNIIKMPWQAEFMAESKKYFAASPRRPGEKLVSIKNPKCKWGFICRMSLCRIKEIDSRHRSILLDKDEELGYELLYHDDRPLRERFEELCHLLVGKFGEEPQTQPEQPGGQQGQPSDKSVPGLEKGHETFKDKLPSDFKIPAEMEEWKKAIKELGETAVGGMIEEAQANKDQYMLFDLCELIAFQQFMIAENEGIKKATRLQGPSIDEVWMPSDSPNDLLMDATLIQNGIFLPGITTIKRKNGKVYEKKTLGSGTLFILLDTSGSMKEYLGMIAALSWAATIGAKRHKDQVALMKFASRPSYLLKPCTDYAKMKELLQTMHASGGTVMTPALKEIVKYSKTNKRKPTIVCFTDTWISNSQTEIHAHIKQINKLGGRLLVCNPDKNSLPWAVNGHRNELLKLFNIGDMNNIGTVIKEFVV